MSGEPIDLSQFRTIASGTKQGQAELRQTQAARLIAQPLAMILFALMDGGYLAAGETLTIPVITPTQTITVAFAAGEHTTDEPT